MTPWYKNGGWACLAGLLVLGNIAAFSFRAAYMGFWEATYIPDFKRPVDMACASLLAFTLGVVLGRARKVRG